MNKRLTLQASGNSHFNSYKCSHCGSAQVIASDVQNPHCAFCSEELDAGSPVSRAELTASPEKDVSHIKCVSCGTLFTAESDETAHELVASKYCVNCGGDSLIACDANGEALPEPQGEAAELNAGEDCEDGDCDDFEDSEGVKDALESGIVNQDEEDGYTEMDASTHEDLQWSALDTANGEQTAMMASSIKTGNPVAIFRKENAPAAMQPLFAQSLFVSAFNEVAANDGLATAIKAFGGNYFSPKVLTAADIEAATVSNMEKTALPRFIDCCQMAVEGGVKGLYPDVYTSMQRSIVNELIASGVDTERANEAVRNTFAIHGSDLFGSIVAKAMELYNKDENARMEAKALITGAAVSAASHAAMSEQAKAVAALEKPTPNFGIMNITASAQQNDAQAKALRRQLF